MFFKKKPIINNSIINQFYELNTINNIHELVICYTVIASREKEVIIRAGRLIFKYLQNKSVFELIKIGEHFKQFSSLDWSIDWKIINIYGYRKFFSDKEVYSYLLILGSFHPNGYYREKCLYELINYDNTLPFILLRLNDWVGIIRSLSYTQALKKINTCGLNELLTSLYAVDRIRHSQRRSTMHIDTIQKELLNQIAKFIDSSFVSTILSFDCIVRASIYKNILSSDILNYEQYNDFIIHEKNSFCQLLIIRSILKNNYLSDQQLSYYLNHKSSYIRKYALYHKYDLVQNYWSELEYFLLDPCFSIRDFARFILKKHTNFNILNFYKNSMPHKMAIYGIGECGSQEDAKDIISYLDNNNPQYVAATIHSLSSLLKYNGENIYWKYLFSDCLSISKQSFLAIKYNKIRYGATLIYNEYNNNHLPHIKTYLFKLLLNENAWQRLPYLLILYSSHPQHRDTISQAIKNRTLYYKLSRKESNDIKNILTNKTYNIPQNMIDSILFDLKFVTNKE